MGRPWVQCMKDSSRNYRPARPPSSEASNASTEDAGATVEGPASEGDREQPDQSASVTSGSASAAEGGIENRPRALG